MLYQMLAGRVPFEGSNAAAIMLKHLTEPPPSLRSLRPDLPTLDGMLARALAKRADERYQSAGALLADFKGVLGGRASQPIMGIGDAPTKPSQAFYAPTLKAANPPVVPPALIQEPQGKIPNLPLATPRSISAQVNPSVGVGARKKPEKAIVRFIPLIIWGVILAVIIALIIAFAH